MRKEHTTVQEFDKQFNKPVDNVILDRPTGTSGVPRQDISNEKAPRFSKKQKLIAALAGGALLAGIGGGVVAATSGERAPEAPANTSEPVEPAPVDPVDEEPTEPTTPEAPSAGEFLIPLEQLAEMSPEEITSLSTISVESVTVDGKIDWGLYSQKVVDILELFANAGSSQTELEAYYNDTSVEPTVEADKYEAPIKAGIGLDSLNLAGLETDHNNQVNTAFIGYLLDTEPVVTNMNLVDFRVDNENSSTAQIEITINKTDNFFSSGALNADSSRDTAFGRSEDLNATTVEYFNVVFLDGNIKLQSITT